MPTEGRATFSSVLPYDEVEGKDADTAWSHNIDNSTAEFNTTLLDPAPCPGLLST